MSQQPTSNQPQSQEPRLVRWLDVRSEEGDLLCRVDADNRTHIEIVKRWHGQKKVSRFLTTTLAVTGSKAV